MDSQIRQGYGLGFAITPVWVGSQTVLLDWMVALAGLHAEEGCRQVLCLDRLLAMLWNQTDYRLCPKVGQGLGLHFTIR